jgi:hypothetical protein
MMEQFDAVTLEEQAVRVVACTQECVKCFNQCMSLLLWYAILWTILTCVQDSNICWHQESITY